MTTPTQDTPRMAAAQDGSPEKLEFWLVLAALTLIYVVAVAAGNRRYVWFDELFTFDIARSPSLQQLWHRELSFDCNPPTVYLLSRVSMSVLGAHPFALRLPSMMEFYLGSMAILLYVRRKASLAVATLVVLLLWTAAPTLYYAVEARPYALIFAAFSCLLLSWDTAQRTQPRRLALFGVVLATFLLSIAHVFAPFTLLAFIVAETVRCRRRQQADYSLWAALLLPMAGMLVYLPLIRSCGGIIFPRHASYNTIVLFFEATFSSPVIAAALLAVLLVPSTRNGSAAIVRFQPEEIALFAYIILLGPVLLIAYLTHRQGLFYDRYCMTSQVAIFITLGLLLSARLRVSRLPAYAGAMLVACFLVKTQVWHTLLYPAPKNAAFLSSIEPALPLVVGEGQVFMEMNQYESAALLQRLYFLKDQQASMQYRHTNIFQNFGAPDLMKQAGFPFSANIESYSGFVLQHRQFLFLGSPTDWVFAKLLASGANIAFVGDYSGSMPYFDSTVYRVTLPSQ